MRKNRGVLIYTIVFVLWSAAFLLPWGKEWPLQGTAIIGSWFYLPMWVWGGIAIIKRNRVALVILTIPFLLFLHDYGRYFTPRWLPIQRVSAAITPNSQDRIPLRVMTWNSYYRNRNSTTFVTTIEALQPDVVAIQELGHGLAPTIAEELQQIYPYQQRFPAGGPSGMALLSRYPIVQQSVPDFSYNGCNCQQIRIDVDGVEITVLNTHPWPPHIHFHRGDLWGSLRDFTTANQDETFDALLARIGQVSTPLLLLGDLNTTERQYNYDRVNALLTDAFAEAGWGMGYTFPTVKRVYGIPVFPVLRLDYIFHSAEWQTEQIWRGTIDGSDHRYLVADLVLEQ